MRVANKDARKYVNELEEFKGSYNRYADASIFAENSDNKNLYVVYSYGYHFPMYIYDRQAGIWIGSNDKHSPTTSKHQSQCRPSDLASIENGGRWLDTTEQMKDYIRCGSLMAHMEVKAKVA